MGQSDKHVPDRLLFAVFLAITLYSIYLCFVTIFVERQYSVFETEEQVESALRINLLSTLRQLL